MRLPRYSKGGIKMREEIIKRILALSDEQLERLIELLQQEEARQKSTA